VIPKPIIEAFGEPERITFSIKGRARSKWNLLKMSSTIFGIRDLVKARINT